MGGRGQRWLLRDERGRVARRRSAGRSGGWVAGGVNNVLVGVSSVLAEALRTAAGGSSAQTGGRSQELSGRRRQATGEAARRAIEQRCVLREHGEAGGRGRRGGRTRGARRVW